LILHLDSVRDQAWGFLRGMPQSLMRREGDRLDLGKKRHLDRLAKFCG